MAVGTHWTDRLLVQLDQSHAGGENWRDNRTIWHGIAELALSSGGLSPSQWYKDAGPRGMAVALLEPRTYCVKGQAVFSFAGRTLIVRLNVAFSWFTGATVTIDGVPPSTLGLHTAVDRLSCDAADHGLPGDGYVDVIVADGLADAAHTCTIRSDSPDPAKFFSIAGFKEGTSASQMLVRTGAWLVAGTVTQNLTSLMLRNTDAVASVGKVALTAPGGVTIVPATGTLAPLGALAGTFSPVFLGREISGNFDYPLTLTVDYPDPSGVPAVVTKTIAATDPSVALVGTWFDFQGGKITSTAPSTLTMPFVGPSLSVATMTAFGRGDVGVYAADGVTLLATLVNIAADEAVTVRNVGVNFGPGAHTVVLRKTVNDGLFIGVVYGVYQVTETRTTVAETVLLRVAAQQPVAMPVNGVTVLSATNVIFDSPLEIEHDFVHTPMRTNADVAYTESLSRVPSYAVYYGSGQADLLAGYDILIVDPLAARTADVQRWQALGIEVYGYISSGEEIGTYSNRYDFASALAPFPGAGPGGHATYYMRTLNPVEPDQDGVWSAYYCNPDPAFGWPTRLHDYYAPQVLGGPLVVAGEVVTVHAATISVRGSVLVFDTAHAPIDADESITVTTLDGGHTYATYGDYTFDGKNGAFVLADGIVPPVTAGQQLKISYTRKGHRMDGVFWDVVDTPDVYTGNWLAFPFVPGYAAQYAAMINAFSAAFPNAKIISNRGFTILANIIASCDGVMFETGLTTPTDITDLVNTDYKIITDPATVAANNQFNLQLRGLREDHVFDVYSLNYCHPDARGDPLRAYCRQQDASRGYLSWQATITLDAPTDNADSFAVRPVNTPTDNHNDFIVRSVQVVG